MSHKKSLKLTPHSIVRLNQRFGINDVPKVKFEFIRKDTLSRTLCKYSGTDIYFIIRKRDRTILTFLTKEQAEDSFGIEQFI